MKTKTLLLLTLLAFTTRTLPAQQWTMNNLPAGLIAWWQAEGDMLDTLGVHNGAGSAAPTYAPGRFGQAFQFNGTNQSVSVPDGYSDLDSWTQFTLEAWVYLDNRIDGTGGGQAILSKVGDGRQPGPDLGYQFGFGLGATKLFCQFNASGQPWPGFQTVADLGGSAPTNTWLHVAATYDHNAVKIYFNGVPLVTNVIGPTTIVNCDASLRLNSDDNENVYFAGRIDDARIYNRALTESEIVYVFTGRPQLAMARVAANVVVLSWPLAANEWVLERTNALGVASTAWPQIPPPYQTNGVFLSATITNSPPASNQFFRLRKP